MPPNGVEEWRARIGNWENRKLRWYQARSGSRRRVPLNLGRVILEAPLLCLLLLLLWAEKLATGMCEGGKDALLALGSLASRVRCCACRRSLRARATPLFSLFLAVSLLLIVAGDVETNPGPINDEFLARVDNSELTAKDIHEVCVAVHPCCASWSGLCIALKLPPNEKDAIAKTYHDNPKECLQEVMTMWLRKNYDYQNHGHPSWRFLVQAVADPVGGNDCALAETIGNNHADVPSQVILEELGNEQAPGLQLPTKELSGAEEAVKLTTLGDSQSTSDDEEWDPPAEFADMLSRVSQLLNKSADVNSIKRFLKFFSHPRTHRRYIDVELYEQCNSPEDILEKLYPRYINFTNIRLLRLIVNKYGDDQSKYLVKCYEDSFPRKRPLKRMHDPLSDEDIESCTGAKRMNVMYNGNATVDNTTINDVERVQEAIERNTEIDQSVIVYAKQTRSSVIFTFLIPETVVSVFSDLDEDNERDLADHGILRIEVNDQVIDLQLSQAVTKTDTERFSGVKRIPITEDSHQTTPRNSEFLQLTLQVGNSLAESVETSRLKDFLLTFNHILYPESPFIDSSIMKGAKSVREVFSALNPQVMNFLNWGILQKVVDAFDTKLIPAVQSYAATFSPHTPLSTLPDALSEDQILEFSGIQRLRVSRGGSNWTLGDVLVLKEAVEKATGIDKDFIIYAYWEGGFSTDQFTFLIPESVGRIFSELCEEDLAILADVGVQSLELDYDIVADNIQKLYNKLPQRVVPVSEKDRTQTKNFGLEHFIPESDTERLSKEDFRPMELSTDRWLKQQYLEHDSWQQWREVPNLTQFDQRLGELKSSASKELRKMDYSTSYFDMAEDPLVITPVSVKSLINKITHLGSGCILIKGAPDQGKSFLLTKLCQYWALGYGMRRFALMFWVDCLRFQNTEIGLLELLSQLLLSAPQNVSSLCRWIENRLGQDVIFIFDGYNCQQELIGDIFQDLASQRILQKSVVLITSTCTPKLKDYSYSTGSVVKQYELLTLTDTQIFKQVLRFFSESPTRAEDFLLYLTIHPDMKVLASSPTHLYTLLLIYNDVVDGSSSEPPVTWTEMFTNTTLFLLRSTFPSVLQTGKKCSDLPGNVQSFLYDLSASAFEDLSSEYPHRLSLSQQIIALLDHKFALVHRCSTPLASKEQQYFQFFSKLLQQFLAAVHIARLPSSQQTILMAQEELNFMWQFYAGLITSEPYETFQVLKERYCKGSIKALANCAYEANWVYDMPSIIQGHILTAADIHHLNVASDVRFEYCCFGKRALFQLSRQAHAHVLNGDQGSKMSFHHCVLPNDDIGSLAVLPSLLQLRGVKSTGVIAMGEALKKSKILEVLDLADNSDIRDAGAGSIAAALKVNQSLKTLSLCRCGMTSKGARALGEALQENNSLEELSLTDNRGIGNAGTGSIAAALKVNQSLKTLSLDGCGMTSTGARALGEALQENNSLEELNLTDNRDIGDAGTGSIAAALKVNQSLKTLSLYRCGMTSTGARALSETLQENNSLEELSLTDNRDIGDAGTGSIAAALKVNQSLKRLSLYRCGMTSMGARALSETLLENNSLEELSLGFNDIGDHGATSLGDALRVNHSLKTLNLRTNGIGDRGATSLGDALRVNHSLETLELWWNPISQRKKQQLTQQFGSRISIS